MSVFHKFVIIASTRDMARQIFNAPAYVKPCVVDVEIKLLRKENFVFLDGKIHVEYRRGLNGLFTRQSLAAYLPGQQEVYEEYFESFFASSEKARRMAVVWGRTRAARSKSTRSASSCAPCHAARS